MGGRLGPLPRAVPAGRAVSEYISLASRKTAGLRNLRNPLPGRPGNSIRSLAAPASFSEPPNSRIAGDSPSVALTGADTPPIEISLFGNTSPADSSSIRFPSSNTSSFNDSHAAHCGTGIVVAAGVEPAGMSIDPRYLNARLRLVAPLAHRRQADLQRAIGRCRRDRSDGDSHRPVTVRRQPNGIDGDRQSGLVRRRLAALRRCWQHDSATACAGVCDDRHLCVRARAVA